MQYLGDPPMPEYPRLSIRAGETGRVMLRVYIDEAGAAAHRAGRAQLGPSAARRGRRSPRCSKARFKPYTENGQPVAGWAFIPLDFELEK